MTHRSKQLSIPGCEEQPTRATGGTYGGGRERENPKDSSIRAVIMWDEVRWPGPTEPECFWAYWLNDDVIPQEEE